MSNTRTVKVKKEGDPVPLGKGRYAFYQTPDGDGLIAYRPDGQDTDSHQVIPRGVWQLILKAFRGESVDASPVALMKMFLGGGK